MAYAKLNQKFLKEVEESTGIVQDMLEWFNRKQKQELVRAGRNGKRRNLKASLDVPKLEDATAAGSARGNECTLILTEGDSAKALALAGLSVVGREKFGVYPLRGKMLNVRQASNKQIVENKEIQDIIKILGLQHETDYSTESSRRSLRYGKVLIMADQDHDGSHIKGLFINILHFFWPSLLEANGFVQSFSTAIIKASAKNEILRFYSLPEYTIWKNAQGSNASKWSIKYYKGVSI